MLLDNVKTKCVDKIKGAGSQNNASLRLLRSLLRNYSEKSCRFCGKLIVITRSIGFDDGK